MGLINFVTLISGILEMNAQIFLAQTFLIRITQPFYSYFLASMYRLHNSSEHSGVTNMYSLSNAGGSRSGTPTQLQQQHQAQQLQQQQQQTHQQLRAAQQYLLEDNTRLNGGISHSYTLPHNLSHHGGGIIAQSNKALAQQQLQQQQQQHQQQQHHFHTINRYCKQKNMPILSSA